MVRDVAYIVLTESINFFNVNEERYNFLNLPDTIVNSTGDTVIYYYDAMGTKLKQRVIEDDTVFVCRYYFNGFEYNDTLVLDIIHNEEGYVSRSTEDYQYNYYLRDHLGNVRVVFTPASTRAEKLIQATDYYPFGMKYSTQVYVSGENKYLFNGKELQDEMGWETYDFHTRFYDPVIGRFMTQDPMGESMNAWSPYSFTFNNPIIFIDPTGMVPTDFLDEDENLIKHVDDGSNAVFKAQGEGVDRHYEFKEFDETQGGENNVNVTSVVEAQQEMNLTNESLQQDENGATYCNRATRNILNAVESGFKAMNYMEDANIGMPIIKANPMIGKMEGNSNFTTVNKSTAFKKASKGHLVIAAWKNPDLKKSGHLATLTVGNNKATGVVANVGTKKWSGFVSLGSTFTKEQQKSVQYFMIKYK